MKNNQNRKSNQCASVSISFDFESSAQNSIPNLRSTIKSQIHSFTNKIGITNNDLSSGFGRGYGNRIGAEKIILFFKKYEVKATWFCTGHILLKGNIEKDAYRINQKLAYATSEAGFSNAVTWREKEASFYHEPYSDFNRFPYYYLGDLAEILQSSGQDIQCHSFSHPYISMEPNENIKTDLEDWQNTAKKAGISKSIIFAFPFLGDYHLLDKSKGIKIVPANQKPEIVYEPYYLKENVLEIFKYAGFELFTRCGSLYNNDLINNFTKYRNSDIYCIKDYPLLSFKDLYNFENFLIQKIRLNANVDLWLHPNDIMEDEKFALFKSYVELLVRYRDQGKVFLGAISEQWDIFKQERHPC